MEVRIQKHIIDYFSFFEEFHNSAKSCLKDCQSCAITINKLAIRCKKISEADLRGTPLEELEGLQGKLNSVLHNLIEEEIEDIKSIVSKLNELTQKLCSKYTLFQESIKDIDFTLETPLVKGTPLQPPLKVLSEYSADCVQFAQEVYTIVTTFLEVLSFKGLNTEPLVDNFKISPSWHRKTAEILSYTAFVAENQI